MRPGKTSGIQRRDLSRNCSEQCTLITSDYDEVSQNYASQVPQFLRTSYKIISDSLLLLRLADRQSYTARNNLHDTLPCKALP
jgi:hypothetical protein